MLTDERRRILVDDQAADELDLVGRERLALRLGSGRRLFLVARRHADGLARLDPVARRGAVAVEPQLTGARPARDRAEARLGQVAAEPAVETDAVILVGDGERADLVRAHAPAPLSHRPTNSRRSEPSTDETTYRPAVQT